MASSVLETLNFLLGSWQVAVVAARSVLSVIWRHRRHNYDEIELAYPTTIFLQQQQQQRQEGRADKDKERERDERASSLLISLWLVVAHNLRLYCQQNHFFDSFELSENTVT